MIWHLLIDMFFAPLNFFIKILPEPALNFIANVSIPKPLKYGANFFPMDLLLIIVTSFVIWYTIFMIWAVIEWVYKKIPGVD